LSSPIIQSKTQTFSRSVPLVKFQELLNILRTQPFRSRI